MGLGGLRESSQRSDVNFGTVLPGVVLGTSSSGGVLTSSLEEGGTVEGVTVLEQELQQRQEVGEADSQEGTHCPVLEVVGRTTGREG